MTLRKTQSILLLLQMFCFSKASICQNFVHTLGQTVLDTNNVPLHLHGINIGGWLVQENWMCGINDTSDLNYGRNQLYTLESRFSSDQVRTLCQTWRENWFNEQDLSYLHSLGFNFIRVPFSYRNLQNPDLSWYTDSLGNIDFTIFDWLVTNAKSHNLYVLFDYHIWLNQHINYGSISDVDSVKLHTAGLWKQFAQHFRDNNTVLGYDLLNEPTGSFNDHVMDMIYDSIRSIDTNHMISMEWVHPDPSRWQNTLYQDHFYGLSANELIANQAYFDQHYQPIIHLHDSLNVPFYVGETHCYSSDSTWKWSLDQYCQQGIHWSPWTYKTVNMWGWGLINVNYNSAHVNLNTDSYETIMEKWTAIGDVSNWFYMNNLIEILADASLCDNSILTVNESNHSDQLIWDEQEHILTLGHPLNFTLLDQLGRIVFVNNSDQTSFHIEGLRSGFYFLHSGNNGSMILFYP